MNTSFDFTELIKRIVKYLIEGLAVAVVALIVPRKALNFEEIVIIALTAAAAFSILDVFVPSMGSSMRGGAGFGLGAGLVGGLPLAAM
jgi:ABC-type Co2+ transport system permease subunit